MHAVIDLADQNSRMKDYYDLYRILKDGKFDSSVLQKAIIKRFRTGIRLMMQTQCSFVMILPKAEIWK